MSDARFPERWLNDRRVLRLSDADFRTFVTTLAWSVANRTDGRLEPDDLELLSGARDAVPRLAQAGLWETANDTVTIIDYDDTQTSSEQFDAIDERRRRDRERKRAGRKGTTSTETSEQTSTRTSERNPLGKGKGQGQAKAHGQEEEHAHEENVTCGWCGKSEDCRCIGSEVSPSYTQTSSRELADDPLLSYQNLEDRHAS